MALWKVGVIDYALSCAVCGTENPIMCNDTGTTDFWVECSNPDCAAKTPGASYDYPQNQHVPHSSSGAYGAFLQWQEGLVQFDEDEAGNVVMGEPVPRK